MIKIDSGVRSILLSMPLLGARLSGEVLGSAAAGDGLDRSGFSYTHGASNMIRCRSVLVAAALSALAAQPAFPQAAIQEPGAFEFYHPNEDVLNGGAPAAALASTARAYAAIDDASIDRRSVRKEICLREPRVGAFATQPWSSGSPCAPAAGY